MHWPCLLSALVTLGPSVCHGQNLAANGAFEELAEDGATPARWLYIDPDDGDGRLTTDEGLEGGRCARVDCTRAEGRWGPSIGQTGVVAAKAGLWYELTFWAKQEGIGSGITAGLRDTRDWSNLLWQSVYPTSTWREYKLTFSAGKDLQPADSRLQFGFDKPGTLWIDGVSLVETKRPKSQNVIDLGDVKNRVPNSSFEVGTYGWGTYGTTFLVGDLDDSTAHHGTHSFRLDISPEKLPIHWNDFTYALGGKPTHEPPPSVSLVTHGYLPVTPGEAMVVSAYVKADKPGGTVRLGLTEDSGADRRNSVDVGTEWTRVVVPVTPEAETAFVRIELEPGEGDDPPTTLCIDAVQLEEGEGATEYAPALPVEVGFEASRAGNVYYTDRPPWLDVLAYNDTDTTRGLALSVAWEDFFRRTTAGRKVEWSLRPQGTHEGRVMIPGVGTERRLIVDPGFYRLHAMWEDEAGPQVRHLRVAVIHPLREEYDGQDTFLGQNHSFVTDDLMTLTRDAGTSWVRSWFVRWDDIEPEEGRFDFSEADAQLDRLESLGFNVQFVLGDPTSEWASTAPADLTESTGGEAESRRVWWMPRDMQAYEDYVTALMERYGDRVKHWEVMNEPVDQKGGPDSNLDMKGNYVRFVEAAVRAAERSGKDLKVMGAGLGYLKGMDDMSPVLSAIDVLSEHRYPGLASAYSFQGGIRGDVDTMREQAVEHPIWLTEYGIYADDDPDPTTISSRFLLHAGEDSEMLAATAAIKHQVVALASGADKVFFHVGNWPIWLNREHGCGFHPFFEWGGSPRKMFVAQNVLCRALPPGSEFVRGISDEPPVMAYEFATTRGTTFVAWAEAKVALEHAEGWTRRSGWEGLSFTDVTGGRSSRLWGSARGSYRERALELDEFPTYVFAPSREGADVAREMLHAFVRQHNANG